MAGSALAPFTEKLQGGCQSECSSSAVRRVVLEERDRAMSDASVGPARGSLRPDHELEQKENSRG